MVHSVLPAPASTALPYADTRIEKARAAGLYAIATSAVTAGWAASVWVSQHIEADPVLHEIALFGHLAALVAGMGAVLTLDWFGLRWMLGHHDREDVMRLAGGCHTLIWGGLIALTLSGMFLSPDLSAPLTVFKLGCVLAVALNGVHAHLLQQQLANATTITPGLLARAGMVATISQIGWWGAVVVGYINAR